MQLEQRSETYRMYVTDSLFFLQHLIGGGEDDQDRKLFASKYRDIMQSYDNNKEPEDADGIIDRMIEKSNKLSGSVNNGV